MLLNPVDSYHKSPNSGELEEEEEGGGRVRAHHLRRSKPCC